MELKEVEVGKTYHIHIGHGKPYKIYVEYLHKDIYGGIMVIYRWYGRHKQWWHTVLEDESVLLTKINRIKKENNDTKKYCRT